MRTEDLIAELGGAVRRAPGHAAVRRLCTALGLGAAVAFVLLLVGLGLRPDLQEASHTAPFWMKWMFTLSLAWASVLVVRRLGDPDGRVGLLWLALAAPVAIVAMMAAGELAVAPEAIRPSLIIGRTAPQCTIAIPLLSIPIFLSLMLAFRRLAPTRLRLTGAASGLLAGSAAASVYAFACPEHSAAFMVTWYSAGIAVAGLLGAIAGPRLLRW
jgi:hypothetical protein